MGLNAQHQTLKSAGCPDDLCKTCPPELAATLAGFDFGSLQKIIALAIQFGPQAWALIQAILDASRKQKPEPAVPAVQT